MQGNRRAEDDSWQVAWFCCARSCHQIDSDTAAGYQGVGGGGGRKEKGFVIGWFIYALAGRTKAIGCCELIRGIRHQVTATVFSRNRQNACVCSVKCVSVADDRLSQTINMHNADE